MAKLKQKIWAIFALIFIISLLAFGFVTVYLHDNTVERFHNEQKSSITLFSNSVHAFFRTQDALLHILGLQMVAEYPTLTHPVHDKTLDEIMVNYPALLGLGLVAYDGTPLVASSNFDLNKLPNLMELPQTKPSFQIARSIDKISIGPTYLVNALKTKTYAMPIRRSIYAGKDRTQPIAVMTAGIRIDNSPLFGVGDELNSYHNIQIIRKDGYNQYSSDSDINYSQKSNQDLLPLLNSTFSEAISNELPSIQSINYIIGDKNQHLVVKYDPYSELFFVSNIKQQYINQIFISRFMVILGFFVSSMFILFILIRSIANSEIKTNSKLVYQAQHDSLTNLPNRQYLRSCINEWINSESGNNPPFALMYIDIDNFKSVNDSYGHEFGDKVLIQATQRLSQILASDGLLIRESSDEFIFLTYSCEHAQLQYTTKLISTSLAEPYIVKNSSILLGSCIGVSRYPENGVKLNDLLSAADIALHSAKKKRNSTCFFSSQMQEEHYQHVQLEQKLRVAIEQETPFMVYQPQVDKNGEIYGVEALVRWIDETLGFVSPEKFIAIAESTGLMSKLGQLIIDKSLTDLSKLNRTLGKPLKLSINISVRQFTEELFAERILASIKAFGLSPEIITLEITENLFIEDLNKIKPICAYLQKQGIQISLDDFGTGYSSLSMLNELVIDELKIDKSFVDKIDEDSRSLAMITNVISIGQRLGMTIIAEGVETSAQKQLLIDNDCFQFQGYYFSKPLPYDQLCQYMNEK